MRPLNVITLIALLGAVAMTVLYFMGTDVAAPIAFVLGAVLLTSASTAALRPTRAWGVPGDHG